MLNIVYSPPSSSWLSVEDELDEDELELLLDEDEELELSFSVSELELSWFETVLSCVVLSAELCCFPTIVRRFRRWKMNLRPLKRAHALLTYA